MRGYVRERHMVKRWFVEKENRCGFSIKLAAFNTANTRKSVSRVVKGKWAGECGWVSRVDFACVQWCPQGKGYLKKGTESRVSTLTKKRGERSGAGHFQCPPRKNTQTRTECAQAASVALNCFLRALCVWREQTGHVLSRA